MIDVETNFNSIETQLERILNDFEDESAALADKIIKEKAQELRDLIKERSPYNEKNTSGKHYRDGWTISIERFGSDKIYVIHNESKPTLTHILEFGWINQRTGKLVGKYPHIFKSHKEVQERLLEALLKLI